VLVERAEVGQIRMCLLEVIAEDLLELGLATALAVDGLGPLDEPLVERRPGSLDLLVRVDPVVDLQRLSIVQVLLYDGDAAYSKG